MNRCPWIDKRTLYLPDGDIVSAHDWYDRTATIGCAGQEGGRFNPSAESLVWGLCVPQTTYDRVDTAQVQLEACDLLVAAVPVRACMGEVFALSQPILLPPAPDPGLRAVITTSLGDRYDTVTLLYLERRIVR